MTKTTKMCGSLDIDVVQYAIVEHKLKTGHGKEMSYKYFPALISLNGS